MVRVKKPKEVISKSDWVFKVDIDLNVTAKPKVAFLSGLERSYYPEDPGFSKFSLVYQNGGFEDESPPCTYLPHPHALVDKPISNFGYGIGGLSGDRFPPLVGAQNPSPDKYQPELVKPLLKSKRRPVPEEQDIFHLHPDDPLLLRKQHKLHFDQHLQCYVSFGSNRFISRFGNPPLFSPAGVGSYNLGSIKRSKPLVTASFGRSPVISSHPTDVMCVYDKEERCIECGKFLYTSDFYRTRFAVEVPWPETRPRDYLEKDFPKGMKRVNLCNKCYYRASIGESDNWPKNKLSWLFRKTRTCALIHDHQGFPSALLKADCKIFKKLQRKEAILSKYYPDRVAESIPFIES